MHHHTTLHESSSRSSRPSPALHRPHGQKDSPPPHPSVLIPPPKDITLRNSRNNVLQRMYREHTLLCEPQAPNGTFPKTPDDPRINRPTTKAGKCIASSKKGKRKQERPKYEVNRSSQPRGGSQTDTREKKKKTPPTENRPFIQSSSKKLGIISHSKQPQRYSIRRDARRS